MKKILIIDYDQNSLATLQGIFSGRGYEVVTAADGQTGWDRYNKESPDLVLMEAMLPKVHGFELCQRITSERNSQATVFIMTGVYKDRVYRTEALRTYGASEYFEKPLKMAELLASVEAVLGKPEPRPAAEPAPAAAAAAGPAPAAPRPAPAAEPRRREKPKDDDSLFALPEDLDRLSRETPKARRPAPVPVRREPAGEARLDAATDELLKNVLLEHMAAAKTVVAKPAGGNGNGNGNGNGTTDIDKFLKSALADLDLTKEKVKVPKTAPLPPPAVKAQPRPAPVPPAEPRPKPTPPPAPAPALETKPRPAPPVVSHGPAAPAAPAADMKNTLTPGDPGSDISPFFKPEKPRPEPPAERPRPAPAEKRAAPAPAPRETPRREPARTEAVLPEAARKDERKREAEALASTDIFQDVGGDTEKKGFPKIALIGIGIAAVAALGFVLLRPKRPAPVQPPAQRTETNLAASNVPAAPVEEAPAPEAKPAPVKPKPQPKAKTADPGEAAADAILPTQMPAAALPPLAAAANPGTASGQNPAGTVPAPVEAPAVKTAEADKPAADPAAGAAQGAAGNQTAAAPAPVPATPVREGDLVELGTVTELPKLLKSVNPIYPSAAQRIGLGGSITVNALIDERGNVIDTGILKGIQDDNGLGKAAEAAIRKWKFQPATKAGVAVKVWKSFVIVFKPEADPARSIA